MSNTTLNYLVPFTPVYYVEGMEKRVMEGYRLSLIRWKTPSKEVKNAAYKKLASVCVPVPSISLTVVPDCLANAMSEAISELQDKAIRSIVAGKLEEDGSYPLTSIVIPEALGTPAGLAAWQAVEAASGRLSKDSLSSWFDAVLADALVDAVSSRLDANDPTSPEKAVKQVEAAKIAIVALASPRAAMSVAVAMQLKKAIAFAPSGDKTRQQLDAKLEIFINPPSTEELMLSL